MDNITTASNGDHVAGTFPRLLPSFGWIALYFVLQGLFTGMLWASGMGRTDLSSNATLTSNPVVILWGLVGSAILQLVLMGLYLRKKERMARIGLTHFGHLSLGRTIGLGALLVVAAMVFNFLYATYIIPGIGMQEEMAKILAAIPRTPINLAAGFFAIAIAAPLVEELMFRGFLQTALARHVPIWAAIMLSSFAFSLVHLQPYAIPGLMSLSMAFGYLYHRTGSLRTNILFHMANNALALILTQGMS
ncbi:MAG: CPBP family intramembrane glutamic endopeptidase [Sphingorhabdus sp.]